MRWKLSQNILVAHLSIFLGLASIFKWFLSNPAFPNLLPLQIHLEIPLSPDSIFDFTKPVIIERAGPLLPSSLLWLEYSGLSSL